MPHGDYLLDVRRVAVTTLLVALACSQRVTPEEEYAALERERSVEVRPASEAIRVTVEGPAGRDAAVGPSGVAFVFVRADEVTGGPPLAVRRIPAPEFPLVVTIGPEDAMIAGTTFPSRVRVEARLDRDGDAFTVGADDWVAERNGVTPGGEARLVLAPAGGA